ncbi:MAG: FHA domain-containing protein [Coprobacillus cateniformis]|nr:FHA domain-containing protein [Coprobacillus cateniformis]
MKPILELKKDVTRKYLEYRITDIDLIDTFSEGMLKNNVLKGVLSICFQQIDTDKFYCYDVSQLISLKEFFNKPIGKKDLIHIFISIIDIYSVLNEYMVEENYLLLDFEYIFIDQITKEVKGVCLPLNNLENNKTIYDFIKETIMSVQYNNEDNSYITKLLNYINSSSNSSLMELKNYLNMVNQESISYQQMPSQQTKSVEPTVKKTEPPVQQKEEIPTTFVESAEVPKMEERKIPSKTVPRAPLPKANRVEKTAVKQTKKGRIPTLRHKNDEDEQIESENIKIPSVKEPKEKKKLLNSKEAKSSRKIPSLKKSENKIPKISKRISGEEAKKTLTGGLQREVQQIYQEDLTTVQASGTTVLGAGTTVLGAGTTVLSDTSRQIYAKLTRISTQTSVVIDCPNFKIGRNQSNSFAIIDNTAVSGAHAEIITKDGRYYITDLHSTNKTYVDGVQVKSGSFVEIFDGSRIKLANEDLLFNIVEEN